MGDIAFTQYMMPDWRRRETLIDRPDAVIAQADTLRAAEARP